MSSRAYQRCANRKPWPFLSVVVLWSLCASGIALADPQLEPIPEDAHKQWIAPLVKTTSSDPQWSNAAT